MNSFAQTYTCPRHLDNKVEGLRRFERCHICHLPPFSTASIIAMSTGAVLVLLLGFIGMIRLAFAQRGPAPAADSFLLTLTAQAIAAVNSTQEPPPPPVQTPTRPESEFGDALPETASITNTAVQAATATGTATAKPTSTHTSTLSPSVTPIPSRTATVAPSGMGFELAFASDSDGNFKIYLMNPDNLTDWHKIFLPGKYVQAWWPSFCGNVIAAEVTVASGNPPQWIDFFDLTGIAKFDWIAPESPEALGVPRCSPDLTYLAYSAKEDDIWNLYVDNLSTQSKILIDTDLAGYGSWDKTETAFYSMSQPGSAFTIRRTTGFPANTNLSSLVSGKYPAVSPDGSQIVYFCIGTLDLCIANANGSSVQTLYNVVYKELNNAPIPATAMWSQDGEWIYFSSADRGNWDIYRIRPDGSGLQNLTIQWTSDELMPALQW